MTGGRARMTFWRYLTSRNPECGTLACNGMSLEVRASRLVYPPPDVVGGWYAYEALSG